VPVALATNVQLANAPVLALGQRIKHLAVPRARVARDLLALALVVELSSAALP